VVRQSSSGATSCEVSWGRIGLSYGTGCSAMYFLGCVHIIEPTIPQHVEQVSE